MLSFGSLKAMLPARTLVAAALTFGSLTASLVPSSVATAQALSPVAAYVPGDSLFYAEFELDLDSDQSTLASDLIERTNLTSLLAETDEQSLDDAVDTLELIVDGEAAVFVSELPVDELTSVVDMTTEATELGMDPATAATEQIPAGWALVVHPTDAEQAYSFYSSLAFGDIEGANQVITTYGGFDIVTVEAEDEYDTPLAMALIDDVIVLASQPGDIEPVIDTVNGDVDSLDSTASFNEVRDHFAPDLLSFAFVNGEAIVAEVEAEGGQEALDYLESQGGALDMFHGIGVWAEQDGFHMETISLPGASGVVPDATMYTGSLAANMPADAMIFSGGMDLGSNPTVESAALVMAQGIISEQTGVDMMATPVSDAEAYADEVFAEAEQYLGFNIKTDVLDSMSGEWAMAATVGEFTGESLPDYSVQMLSEITDAAGPEAAAEALTEEIENADDPSVTVSVRELDGNEITVVEMASDGTTITLEYGAVGDYFAIGINSPLEFATAPASPSLADESVFNDTFATLPQDNITSVSYMNLGLVVPLVQDVISMTSTMSGTSEPDADPDCANYATQVEAQQAYDEDTFEMWNLDLDFDGEACEDFFAPEAAATPAPADSVTINLLSAGSVTWNDGTAIGSSSVILIGG